MTLVPPSLEVVVNVEESRLGRLAEGQAVQLNVAAFSGQPFHGSVKPLARSLIRRAGLQAFM
jgi:multidrug resistance efflux pump